MRRLKVVKPKERLKTEGRLRIRGCSHWLSNSLLQCQPGSRTRRPQTYTSSITTTLMQGSAVRWVRGPHLPLELLRRLAQAVPFLGSHLWLPEPPPQPPTASTTPSPTWGSSRWTEPEEACTTAQTSIGTSTSASMTSGTVIVRVQQFIRPVPPYRCHLRAQASWVGVTGLEDWLHPWTPTHWSHPHYHALPSQSTPVPVRRGPRKTCKSFCRPL